MASSLSTVLSITALLWLSMMHNSSSGLRHMPQDGTLLEKICQDVKVKPFYDFCTHLFSSNPEGSSSNLKDLARIALEKSALQTADSLVTMDDAVRLGVGKGNDTVRVKLTQCSERYSQILGNVAQGFKSSKDGDFGTVDNSAQAIIGQTNECLEAFEGPVEVSDTTTDLHNLAVILSVIAHLSGSTPL
ncbi:hypothetical protein LINPERPRIM_LOCUS34705 [Linum perenne]